MKRATTKVPYHGQSQPENYSHNKTRLLDYHDSAGNVTNSSFYIITLSLLADL